MPQYASTALYVIEQSMRLSGVERSKVQSRI
jgi:hypothetical protein